MGYPPPPALRVARSRAYQSIPNGQSVLPKNLLATDRFWREAGIGQNCDVRTYGFGAVYLFDRRHVAGAVPNAFLKAREKAASEL